MDAIQFLRETPLFASLNDKALWRLAELAQKKSFQANDIILKEGQRAMGCYLITEGEVEVIKNLSLEDERLIATLTAGEILGEMSVIDDEPHSASVRARTDVHALMIETWDFKAQLQAYPEIALQLLPVLSRRLRQASEQYFLTL